MDIGEGGHRSSPAVSVVIDDLHVVRIAAAPAEADTPLVVDPEAAANGVRRTSLHRFTTIPEAPDGVEPGWATGAQLRPLSRSEEHTSELQSLMRISYAVFCLKKKRTNISNISLLATKSYRYST